MKGLQDVEGFIRKCIQLYETTVVRHGLMLVGPTISGKTRVSVYCIHVLYICVVKCIVGKVNSNVHVLTHS